MPHDSLAFFIINAPPANSAHGGAFIARKMVGPNGFEPATSRLSGVRSNQLSYGPVKKVLDYFIIIKTIGQAEFLNIFFLRFSGCLP